MSRGVDKAMADIFISYAREDRETAKTIAQALADRGWSVWWDQSIPPGMTWADVIGKQLVIARCVLALWSKTSVIKRWVLKEAHFADQRGILIPVLIENVEPPFEFSDIQAANLRDWRDDVFHPGYKLLLEAVSEMLSASLPATTDEQDTTVAKRLADEESVVPSYHLSKLEVVSDRRGLPDFTTFCDINAPWCPEMVVLPAGRFLMGSPENEVERNSDEGPQHRVTIGYRFAIGRYAVTFDEFDYFCTATKRKEPEDKGWGRGRRPVIYVSWQDAVAYGAWLANKTGKSYRLPNEAEWEYACRAGTTTRFSCGDQISPDQANCAPGLARGLVRVFITGGKTKEVGSYPPNPWGLYDMHGNVWEWVEDVWHDSYKGAPADGSTWTDGEGEDSSQLRVGRGGSWFSLPWLCRSASRGRIQPAYGYTGGGFRVARTLD